jgi:hypothetical protein
LPATALAVPAGEYGLQIVIRHPDLALLRGYSLDPIVDWLALRAVMTVDDQGEITKRVNMEGQSGNVPDPKTHYPSDRTIWWSLKGDEFGWAQRARPLLTPLWNAIPGTDPGRKGGEDADLLRRLLQPGLRETITVKQADGTEKAYELWRLHWIGSAADTSAPLAERVRALWGFWEPQRVWDAAHPVGAPELIAAVANAMAASKEKPWFSAARYGSADPGQGQQQLVRHFAETLEKSKTLLSTSAPNPAVGQSEVSTPPPPATPVQATNPVGRPSPPAQVKNPVKLPKAPEPAEIFSLSSLLQWVVFLAIIIAIVLAGWLSAARLRKPNDAFLRDRLNQVGSEKQQMICLERLDARLKELERLELHNWQNANKNIADAPADAAVDKVYEAVKRAIVGLDKRLQALEAAAHAVPDQTAGSNGTPQPPLSGAAADASGNGGSAPPSDLVNAAGLAAALAPLHETLSGLGQRVTDSEMAVRADTQALARTVQQLQQAQDLLAEELHGIGSAAGVGDYKRNELKDLLTDAGQFDEADWRQIWAGEPRLEEALVRLLLYHVEPSRLQPRHQTGLASWVQQVSRGRYALIVPAENENFDETRHEPNYLYGRAGRLGRVLAVGRFGLAADDRVCLKATVQVSA